MESEEIVWSGHPSHWHYFWSWVLGILLAPVLIGFFIIVGILLARNRHTYTVTRSKIIVEEGLFAKSSDELRIQDIRSMALKKHGLFGLWGVGDLIFASAAAVDAEVIFSNIPDASHVREQIRELQGIAPGNR